MQDEEEMLSKVKVMTTWPRTPTEERLMRAIHGEQETRSIQEEGIAALHLLDTTGMEQEESARTVTLMFDKMYAGVILDEPEWQDAAVQLFHDRLIENGDNQDQRLRLMGAIGREADTGMTIGLGVMSRRTLDAGRNGQVAIGFARMIREKEWIGYCELLQETSGLVAIVSESRNEPGRVGHVICVPPNGLGPEEEPTDEDWVIPAQEGDELTEILRWHGANSMIWSPAPEEHEAKRR